MCFKIMNLHKTDLMNRSSDIYVSPEMAVIELYVEGYIASSTIGGGDIGVGDWGDGGSLGDGELE